MGTHERRMAIWNTLCQRKQDTAGHLSAEFHVSLRTIYYDLEYLSLIYPLEVIRGRYHGGIKIADYFTPDKTKLTPVQRDLLLRLFTNLYGHDKLIMLSILTATCKPCHGKQGATIPCGHYDTSTTASH